MKPNAITKENQILSPCSPVGSAESLLKNCFFNSLFEIASVQVAYQRLLERWDRRLRHAPSGLSTLQPASFCCISCCTAERASAISCSTGMLEKSFFPSHPPFLLPFWGTIDGFPVPRMESKLHCELAFIYVLGPTWKLMGGSTQSDLLRS